MKKKSKNKNKIQAPRKTIVRAKKFESHYLAIVLIAFLLLEGFMVTSTKASDWQDGVALLDMSTYVSEVAADLNATFQPIAEAVSGVNQFYQLAAIEMTQILDLSDYSPTEELSFVTSGVSAFYNQASTELASLLDTNNASSFGSVAGASIIVR